MPNNHLTLDPQAFEIAKETLQQKFEKIIGYYLEDIQSYIGSIREGLEVHSLEMIIPAAHTIKSSSRQLGAFALANYAANIEEKARSQISGKEDFIKIEEICVDLENMFQITELEIKKRI